MQMTDIEQRAQQYADAFRELELAMQSLEDGVRELKRKMLPIIRRRATAAAERKEELLAAVRSAPELFQRPRTRTFADVKFGYQKRRGQVVIADEDATIRRIRELLPADQAELLIRVRESVHKPAVYDLTVADLKRLGIEIGNDTDEAIAKIAGEDIERMVDALLAAEKEVAADAA